MTVAKRVKLWAKKTDSAYLVKVDTDLTIEFAKTKNPLVRAAIATRQAIIHAELEERGFFDHVLPLPAEGGAL